MKDFINKIFSTIGLDYEDEEEQEEEKKEERFSRLPSGNVTNVTKISKNQNARSSYGSRKSKIVDISTTTQYQVMVMVLEKFDDVIYVADHLKSKTPVVVNVENISDESVVQRIVDFIGGVVYAIDGDVQKISRGILLVTPYTVKIMGDIKNELLSSGGLSLKMGSEDK